MRNMLKMIMKTLSGMMVLLLMVGCNQGADKIVIASKPMTEQFILAEILTQLIEDRTDLVVEQKLGIGGGTSNIHPAMINGEIDVYPEYTGTGWLFVLQQDSISDMNELYEKVSIAYLEEFNIVWSSMYGFNNTYGLAISKDVAEAYDIKTYSDLATVSSELVFAANPDFYEREDGYNALVEMYNFTFKDTKEIDIGLRYEALSSDDVDIITVFTTDARINEENVVIIEDDRTYFNAYHGATLIRKEVLDENPGLFDVLELLANQISNEEMIAMNYEVEIENKDPKVVASEFLREKGLIE